MLGFEIEGLVVVPCVVVVVVGVGDGGIVEEENEEEEDGGGTVVFGIANCNRKIGINACPVALVKNCNNGSINCKDCINRA